MLSLSSEAASGLSLAELDAACRARGLDGTEIVIPAGDDPTDVVTRASTSRARVVALRARALDPASAGSLARCAAALGVPVSVPASAVAREQLDTVTQTFVRERARLLLGHRTKLDDTIELVATIRALDAGAALGLAWEVAPAVDDLGEASAVLLAASSYLGAVRLHGGGPEQRDQDGRGVGPLFAELALSGYAGPIILCPSRPEVVPRWTAWLASTKSSGCGHAVSEREQELDVRDVEPRHRLDTILGAYRTLIPGATLRLTVDHDPVCMNYMLEATEPADSYAFEIVEHGPEIWRANVTKR